MIYLTYYVIMKWDGGDRHYDSDIAFETEEEANKYLKDHRYDIHSERNIMIYKSAEEYHAGDLDRKRQKALKKLTKEERQLLGIE